MQSDLFRESKQGAETEVLVIQASTVARISRKTRDTCIPRLGSHEYEYKFNMYRLPTIQSARGVDGIRAENSFPPGCYFQQVSFCFPNRDSVEEVGWWNRRTEFLV